MANNEGQGTHFVPTHKANYNTKNTHIFPTQTFSFGYEITNIPQTTNRGAT
jgi:hypothetical protein